MALTRRIKKLKNSQVVKITGRQILVCKECNIEEVEVPADIGNVTCADCVQKMLAPPPGYAKEESNKPKGWHFKMFFEHEGIVYSKGEVVTDADRITELKNLSASVPAPKPKSTTSKKRGRPRKNRDI